MWQLHTTRHGQLCAHMAKPAHQGAAAVQGLGRALAVVALAGTAPLTPCHHLHPLSAVVYEGQPPFC